MTTPTYNVLFLCTANSARSLIAEAILAHLGKGRFRAFSAGSRPGSTPHPRAMTILANAGHDVSALRSKSWDEFAAPSAPEMDFIITVCDDAAGETCPVWPGRPATAHWGIPDPARATGTEAEKALAFDEAYRMLERRITLFLSLPIASLDKLSLHKRLSDIGRTDTA